MFSSTEHFIINISLRHPSFYCLTDHSVLFHKRWLTRASCRFYVVNSPFRFRAGLAYSENHWVKEKKGTMSQETWVIIKTRTWRTHVRNLGTQLYRMMMKYIWYFPITQCEVPTYSSPEVWCLYDLYHLNRFNTCYPCSCYRLVTVLTMFKVPRPLNFDSCATELNPFVKPMYSQVNKRQGKRWMKMYLKSHITDVRTVLYINCCMILYIYIHILAVFDFYHWWQEAVCEDGALNNTYGNAVVQSNTHRCGLCDLI